MSCIVKVPIFRLSAVIRHLFYIFKCLTFYFAKKFLQVSESVSKWVHKSIGTSVGGSIGESEGSSMSEAESESCSK